MIYDLMVAGCALYMLYCLAHALGALFELLKFTRAAKLRRLR